jgi:hypothetical protein
MLLIDSDELPGAIKPSGGYTVKGKTVELNLNIIKDGSKIFSKKLKGNTAKIDKLVDDIISTINKVDQSE